MRRIGEDSDVVTFVSRYTRGRFASAFGPEACSWKQLPPGVDTDRFRPDPASRAELRSRYVWASGPRCMPVPAGAAKGPGHVDPGAAVDKAASKWGRTRHRRRWSVYGGAARLVERFDVGEHVHVTGGVPAADLPALPRDRRCVRHAVSYPRVPDWMLRGWASCSWKLPRLACRSLPDPRAVRRKPCGTQDWAGGRRPVRLNQVADAVTELLVDPDRAAAMGRTPAGTGSPRSGGGTIWLRG